MLEKYNMQLDETETVINYSKYHIGDWAEVYTTDKTVMKRYEKFAQQHPDYCRLLKEDKYSMTFSVHPKSASLYPRAPRKLNLTEEQRLAAAERFKQLIGRSAEDT